MGISRIVSSARRREESMTQREMERYESVLFLGVVLFSIFFSIFGTSYGYFEICLA